MTTTSIKAAARALARRRKTFSTGRPPVLRPCKHCGDVFSGRALRVHLPVCPKKPIQRSIQQKVIVVLPGTSDQAGKRS
jgi:hypothetical protein